MTSEVENISNGTVVMGPGSENIKVIAVSTANVVGDENGKVPLSNQDALQLIATTAEPAAEVTAAPVEAPVEALDLTPDAAPEVAAPAPEADPTAAPTFEAAPAFSKAPTEAPAFEPAPNPAAELAPAADGDTITRQPVEVTDPKELESVGFEIPSIPLVSDKKQDEPAPEVEETEAAPAATLPEEQEEVVGAAPETVDNNLFVNPEELETVGTSEPAAAPATETTEGAPEAAPEADPKAAPVATEGNMFTGVEGLDLPELQKVGDTLDLGNSSELPSVAPVKEEATEEEAQELFAPEEAEVAEGLPGVSFGEEVDLGVTPEPEAAEATEVEVNTDTEELGGARAMDIPSEDLKAIIERLDTITETLEDIREKIDGRSIEVREPAELPQADIPAYEAQATETPSLEAPIIEPVEQPTQAQGDDYVNALDQITADGANEVGSVDDTQIVPGKFI